MKTTRLTMAQALVKWMANQEIEQFDGTTVSAFAGVWAIFGHGNVAGLGEALFGIKDQLPTYRGHNEQSMAHAAIAYAKQKNRRQMMAVTTSIGPGATNLVTAGALAHVNRLPVLLLPGDVFANRHPDPVLQQVESFSDGLVSANDCLRPVSRYYDRITRPEQLISALPKAMAVLTDMADCGPVTLGLCQDVQAEAYDYPLSFFEKKIWHCRRISPDKAELERAVAALKAAKAPLIIAGGGVRYSGACDVLRQLSEQTGMAVAATQAGKSSLSDDHENYIGAIGVTGSSSANHMAQNADLVLAVGSRLQDFTTGSNSLIKGQLISVNVNSHDLVKHNAMCVQADAATALHLLKEHLSDYHVSTDYTQEARKLKQDWMREVSIVCAPDQKNALPADSQVIGAVNRAVPDNAIVIGAAGSMPGELHKLWQTAMPEGYHMEYGFSCMGYEVAAGIGVNMACPERPNVIFAGDGSYLMLNSELATAVMMGINMTLIITDNRGFGCINRLQKATGGAAFNNLFEDSYHKRMPEIDFVAHAASMGARAHKADSLLELESLTKQACSADGVDVIVIDSDPGPSTQAGGSWWDVAVPEVSTRKEVNAAAKAYHEGKAHQNKGHR